MTAGVYDIGADKPGFQGVQQRVEIHKDAVTTVSFQLLPVSVRGGLFGTITDPSGAPVSGATVTLTAPDGKTTRVTVNQAGHYAVQNLPAENYTFAVEAPRFQSLTAPVTVSANQLSLRDAQLAVDNESRDWEQAAKSRDAAQVTAFLSKYPRGAHADMAKNLLAQLRSEERAAWTRASSANQVSSYQDFLRRYPNGEYAAAARSQVENLQAELRRRAATTPAAPPVRSDDQIVLDVLAQYQRAYDDRKVEELASIWPSMTSRAAGSLRKFFNDAEQVSLTYDLLGQPQINHDEATIRFRQSLNYTVDGKTQKPGSANVTMRLHKLSSSQGTSGKWVIESIR